MLSSYVSLLVMTLFVALSVTATPVPADAPPSNPQVGKGPGPDISATDPQHNSHCNWVCPDIYKPVCGQNDDGDFKTFPSRCELNLYNCKHPEDEYQYQWDGNCPVD
ncbi:hypothetical protein BGX28_010217 [Mortierella sp. GBA30]|nr:hypothetical protein BGX28_010217 [Mortierella sp. GBA30]